MKVGDVVPDFCLENEKGEEFELYKSLNQKVLLVFYPKDDTPVCFSQLAEYNEKFDEFLNHGIKVIGINSDTNQSHSKFSSKLKLKFPLLSDADKKVSAQLGAINIFGLTKRKLVLIGTDKKVTIPTKAGTIYTFGMDGKGRFEMAHDTPAAIQKGETLEPITLPDGTVIKDYTITLTFRRAKDLEKGVPTTPAKIAASDLMVQTPAEVSVPLTSLDVYNSIIDEIKSCGI